MHISFKVHVLVQNAPPVVARPRIVPSPAAQALEASLYEQSLADFADTAGYTWQLRMKNEKAMQDIDALRRMGKLAYPAKDPFDGPPSCRCEATGSETTRLWQLSQQRA